MQIPDIERAACTILAQEHIAHREIREWIAAIVADPEERTVLFMFQPSLEARQHVDERGFQHIGKSVWDDLGSGVLHGRMPTLEQAGTDWVSYVFSRMERGVDTACARLAAAVVDFRRAGRPSGDVTMEQHGSSSDPEARLVVTTSLAAAVAEYAHASALARTESFILYLDAQA